MMTGTSFVGVAARDASDLVAIELELQLVHFGHRRIVLDEENADGGVHRMRRARHGRPLSRARTRGLEVAAVLTSHYRRGRRPCQCPLKCYSAWYGWRTSSRSLYQLMRSPPP